MSTSYTQFQLSELNVQREVSDAFFNEPWVKTRIRALATIDRKPAEFGTTLEETSTYRKLLRARIHAVAEAYAHHAEELGHTAVDDTARYDYLRFQLAEVYKACEAIDSALYEYSRQSIHGASLLQGITAIGSPVIYRYKVEKLLGDIATGLPTLPDQVTWLRMRHEQGRKQQLGILYRPENTVPMPETGKEPSHADDSPSSPFGTMHRGMTPSKTDASSVQPPLSEEQNPVGMEPVRTNEHYQQTLETLLYRREGLEPVQRLELVHAVRAAIADITLPTASMSWYKQASNASSYRQSVVRSHKDSPAPLSFTKAHVARRRMENALDALAEAATERFKPGSADTLIEERFSALMDSIDQLVEHIPNAKAALGDGHLRRDLHLVLYGAIDDGFRQAAKQFSKSHAQQVQQQRNTNGPSLRGHE